MVAAPPKVPISRELAEQLMSQALELAEKAAALGEVPIAALVASASGEVLASAHNEVEQLHCATKHAEVLALERASEKLGRWRLNSEILVSTLEPCTMCAGAIQNARVGTLVFGARDERLGACGSIYDVLNHKALPHSCYVLEEILSDRASQVLRDFFQQQRD